MSGITSAQISIMHVLAREQGMDDDQLHGHIFKMTKVTSIKKLSKTQAIKVIDSLIGEKAATPGMMTEKQRRLIDGLLKELGWTDESGDVNQERFNAFIKSQFNVHHVKWISVKTASNIIQGLKEMVKREKKGEAI